MKEPIPENILTDDLYSNKIVRKSKIFIWGISLFIIGFIFNFQLKRIVISYVKSGVQNLKGCPITYSSIDVSFLLPHITLQNISIPGACFKNPTINIDLPELNIYFRGPSLYPFGAKFKIDTTHKDSSFNVYTSVSLSKQLLKIDETVISSNSINEFTGGKFSIGGNFLIESLITIEKKRVTDAQFIIKSNDLIIPSQTVNYFMIPTLPVEKFTAKGQYNFSSKKTRIDNLILGSENSPIVINLNGTINNNQFNFKQSILNIDGEVKFTDSFFSDMPLLRTFLIGKSNENGFYKIKISGPIMKPNYKLL